MADGEIGEEHFADLMKSVGPFGPRPKLTVATSGGADSLALCLLTARWTQRHGGAVTALTVDHGLRAGASAAEARVVGGWLARHSIPHVVIRWTGKKPASAIQEIAREARYRLMSRWCREHTRLHLLLGHHRDDQEETLMMRVARGSGLAGLAAMPLISERDGVRYLRPCLGVSHDQLVATLAAWGQRWIEDPSNQDRRYARVRIRAQLGHGALRGAGLATSARRIGVARASQDDETSALLAAAVALDPRGFCTADRTVLHRAERDVVRRALSMIVQCIGGGTYAPRRARVNKLVDRILRREPFPGGTLGGCRLIQTGIDTLLVCRELGRTGPSTGLPRDGVVRWDDRFEFVRRDGGPSDKLTVAAMADNRWPDAAAATSAIARSRLAAAVLASLPAIYRGPKLVAVPHLGLYDRRVIAGTQALSVRFAPQQPLAPVRFSVA